MKKFVVGVVCLALASCNAVTSTNNVLANLSGGTSLAAFKAGCIIVGVAEGYYANVKGQVTQVEALAVASAEAAITALCNNPPTNLTIAFDDLLSAWNVVQAGTTVPTANNPNPGVPTLVVKSIPTPVPTATP